MKTIAVILAGGMGSRFGLEKPKQFAKLAGMNIIDHTLKAFNDSIYIDEIVVVIKDGYQSLVEEIVNKHSFEKVTKILAGGKERSDSSLSAINSFEKVEGAEKFNIMKQNEERLNEYFINIYRFLKFPV